MRRRIAWLVVAAGLVVVGLFVIPDERRAFIQAIISVDQPASEPSALPKASGAGLAPTPRTRVILIDGLLATTAATMPAWNAVCDRGTKTTIDVGFPTVSLPVEVSLWTGLTQQQTGIVFRSDRPVEQPLAAGIPSRVAGSIAIAENHGYIVRSIGFTHVEPPGERDDHAKDAGGKAWPEMWRAHAHEAVASAAPLAFVHVLRVDTAGHKFGGASPEYAMAAREADAILGEMVAAAPDARWFLLSDHGHVAHGGHGGEESDVRHTTACIAGPGIARRAGGTIHVVDISRAIADSVGVPLVPESLARPLDGALAHALPDDAGIPPQSTGRIVVGGLVLLAGLAASFVVVRRRPAGTKARPTNALLVLPYWLPIAIASFVIVRGLPSLSTPMIYPPSGRDMWLTWQPALALGAIVTIIAIRRGARFHQALIGQLAIPIALLVAATIACGGWHIVPYVTAWCSPLLLITGHAFAYIGGALAISALIPTALSAEARSTSRAAAPDSPATAAPPASDPR